MVYLYANKIFSFILLTICSKDVCRPTPEGCSDIIPYTSKTNKLYDLETEEDFKNFSMSLHMALENCTMDKDVARWGACNMMYPRCLLGWELQFCRQSCLGMYHAAIGVNAVVTKVAGWLCGRVVAQKP